MQMFLKNRAGFLASRLVLGLAEAGYIPGAVYTLSMWYKKRELAKRVAVFFFGMFGGNAVSPILASGTLQLSGERGIKGWQWLFMSKTWPLFTIHRRSVVTFASQLREYSPFSLAFRSFLFCPDPQRPLGLSSVPAWCASLPSSGASFNSVLRWMIRKSGTAHRG